MRRGREGWFAGSLADLFWAEGGREGGGGNTGRVSGALGGGIEEAWGGLFGPNSGLEHNLWPRIGRINPPKIQSCRGARAAQR